MTIEERNRRVYNRVISKDIPVNFSQINLLGEVIRDVSIDEYIGIDRYRYCVYDCHCIKCNQELILSTHMLSDPKTHLCYCDIPGNNLVGNLGKYAKKKYDFDIHDPEIKPLFNRWVAMRQRCNNPNSNSYPHYGARGIKVCQEWDNTEDGFLNFYNWAIVLKESGEVIGDISSVGSNEDVGRVHIGYCLGRKWWNKGIMSEALNRVIQFFFEEVEVNRVDSRHDVNNPASGKVMKKCGMVYEGTLRQFDINNEGIGDTCYYGILKSEWK